MKAFGLLVGLFGLLVTAAPALAQRLHLPEVELSAGRYAIRAEVAESRAARRRGLMWRRAMPANHGMLFVFRHPGKYCMWMENTLIPLSVAFLDSHGAIINIAEMIPETANSHCANRPARYALEMSRGWFTQHGLGEGVRVGGLARLNRGS